MKDLYAGSGASAGGLYFLSPGPSRNIIVRDHYDLGSRQLIPELCLPVNGSPAIRGRYEALALKSMNVFLAFNHEDEPVVADALDYTPYVVENSGDSFEVVNPLASDGSWSSLYEPLPRVPIHHIEEDPVLISILVLSYSVADDRRPFLEEIFPLKTYSLENIHALATGVTLEEYPVLRLGNMEACNTVIMSRATALVPARNPSNPIKFCDNLVSVQAIDPLTRVDTPTSVSEQEVHNHAE